MMTADQCRAKADELDRRADEATSYRVMLEWEAMSIAWRWLAEEPSGGMLSLPNVVQALGAATADDE
jgi:hypothetical protein